MIFCESFCFFKVSIDYIIGRTDECAQDVSANGEEQKFSDIYTCAKESDKAAVRSTLNALEKPLGEDSD